MNDDRSGEASSSTETLVRITVIDREGASHPIEVPGDLGLNMMEVMKASGLPVEGTCGGIALCASCHSYVESGHDLPDPSDDELDMLDQVNDVEDNSRLACQIPVTTAIDGLVLKLAPEG